MINRVKDFLSSDDTIELLGYIISIRAFLFGLSFAFNRPEAVTSVLYRHIDAFPGVEPEVFGWILMFSGLATFAGFLFKHKRLVKYTSQFQFLVYTFAMFIYFFNGSVINGLIAAFVPAMLTYIIASKFYFSKSLAEQRAEWGLPPR